MSQKSPFGMNRLKEVHKKGFSGIEKLQRKDFYKNPGAAAL